MESDAQKDKLGVSTSLKGPAKAALEALADKRGEGPNSTVRAGLELLLNDPNVEAILAGTAALDSLEKVEQWKRVLKELTEFQTAADGLKKRVDAVIAREPATAIVERHAQLNEKVDAALKATAEALQKNNELSQKVGESVNQLTERLDRLTQGVAGIKMPTVDLAPVTAGLNQLTKAIEEANKRPVVTPEDLTKVKDQVQTLAGRPGASRLTVIVTGLAVIATTIGVGLWLRPTVATIGDQVTKLNGEVVPLASKVKSLEDRVTETEGRIAVEDKSMIALMDQVKPNRAAPKTTPPPGSGQKPAGNP